MDFYAVALHGSYSHVEISWTSIYLIKLPIELNIGYFKQNLLRLPIANPMEHHRISLYHAN